MLSSNTLPLELELFLLCRGKARSRPFSQS
jgi:hypothetical protein